MTRLITFGCSYTQGIGLDGLGWRDHHYYNSPLESVLKIQSASKDAWPHLLADKLGLECINLGRGGSGPKYIFQMIREFEFQKTDIVVIQWPDPSRHVIWKELLSEKGIVSHGGDITVQNLRKLEFYKNWYTDFDAQYNNAVLIESTHTYLKDKCKNVYSVSSHCEMYKNKTLTKTFPILSEVGRFFDQYNHLQDLCNDLCKDGHPGKGRHVAFAEDMEKIIL
jgi:hypothetical protein